jgi:succinate dehydrogenase / fumarate reductase iron-sulfur subunit
MKDLVTDVSWNYEVKRIKSSSRDAGRPDGTWRMGRGRRSRQELEVHRVLPLPERVPRLRDSPAAEFAGRLRLQRGARDYPLDVEDRVSTSSKTTASATAITKCCTTVCPEHITITDNAIIPLKERVVDQFYDPIGRMFRVFSRRETPGK